MGIPTVPSFAGRYLEVAYFKKIREVCEHVLGKLTGGIA